MMVKELNVLALAYIGDSIYELLIREYLINKGIVKVNDLQTEAINYVSAKAQSKYLKEMLDTNFLTSIEIDIVKRARNHNGTRHPKNTDVVTYKQSTGLEALFGAHYLNGEIDRIKEIINFIIGDNVCIYLEKMSH